MPENHPEFVHGPYFLDDQNKRAITGIRGGKRVILFTMSAAEFLDEQEAEAAARKLADELNFAEDSENRGYNK